MKTTLAFLLALYIGAFLRAEHKTLITSGPIHYINVPTGSVIEILYAQQAFIGSSTPDIGEIWLEQLPNSDTPDFIPIKISTFNSSTIHKGGIFAGPLRVKIYSPVPSVVSYELTDAASGLSASAPSNTVVIPEDATGPVSIILESSTDLVNWTAALPGSYGSSTTKRFFRLRATIQ